VSTVTLLTIEIPRELFDTRPRVISAEWDKGQGYRVRAPNGGTSVYPTDTAALTAAWRLARAHYKALREQRA
jgi:hypothetical protein